MPKYANNVMELGQKRSKRFQTHVLYCPIHDFFYQLTKLIAIEPLIPVLEECHTCDDVWEPTWRQLGRFGSRICYVPFGYSSNYQKHSQDWPAALLNGFKDNGPFLDLEFV